MTPNALSALSDGALLERARTGNRDAAEALIQRHFATAARVAYGVLGRHDEALDAAQEAVLRALRSMDRMRAGQAFRAWLAACVHGVAVNRIRQERSRKRREGEHRARPAGESWRFGTRPK